jgi:ribonuclease HII
MYYFGVDEAGRGPVFGAMYVTCIAANPMTLPSGLADSKTLTNKKISKIVKKLQSETECFITTVEIPSHKIDASDKSISELTLEAFADAIEATDLAYNGYVDACLKDTSKVEARLHKSSSRPVVVQAEHKADESYPIVSAASILAKHARETQVEQLKEKYGDIGSGYPSDPTTKEYLENYVKENKELPPFARESWKTSQKALEKFKA